jgi:hypothetical protein
MLQSHFHQMTFLSDISHFSTIEAFYTEKTARVRVAQWNAAQPAIPTSRRPSGFRSTGAHNNKALSLTQPKRLA